MEKISTLGSVRGQIPTPALNVMARYGFFRDSNFRPDVLLLNDPYRSSVQREGMSS